MRRATNKIYIIPRILNFQFEIISALISEGNFYTIISEAILKIKQKIFQIRVMGMYVHAHWERTSFELVIYYISHNNSQIFQENF